MADTEPNLRPYGLQAGGHNHPDAAAPASLVDGCGRFLKKLQAGERGAREAAFYACMQQHRTQQQDAQQAGPQPPPPPQQQQQQEEEEQQQQEQDGTTARCSSCPDDVQHRLMQQLAAWVPLSYGTREVCGAQYLVMQDLTAGYRQPCILDIKVGYRTWYPWGSEVLVAKYRSKDESTTQGTLGFRLCGMVVQKAAAAAAVDTAAGGAAAAGAAETAAETAATVAAGAAAGAANNDIGSTGDGSDGVIKLDRHWGKQLTAQGVRDALRAYADNGVLSLRDICTGPDGLLAQLQSLACVFEQQTCWQLFSASLLLVYEGAAGCAADARLRVRLIDFAHAFTTVASSSSGGAGGDEAAAAAAGPVRGPDQNFLDGLVSLIKMLHAAMEQQP